MNTTSGNLPWGGDGPEAGSLGLLESKNTIKLVIAAVTSMWLLNSYLYNHKDIRAPIVGYRNFWEPTFVLRLRYIQGAWAITTDGYKKFKDSMFTICRNDTNILMISNKYVQELRALPNAQLGATAGLVKNFLEDYTTTGIMLESDVHSRALKSRFPSNLETINGLMQEELDLAIKEELGHVNTQDWTPIVTYKLLSRIVARITARVQVGLPLCRNEELIHAFLEYTENIFMTIVVLRIFPSILHPVVAWLLPTSYGLHRNLRTGKRLIIPMVHERRRAQAEDPDYKKPSDMLQWIMDIADDDEGRPEKLAHRMMLLSFASLHMLAISMTQSLYDMCTYPEFIAPLREEMEESLDKDGNWGKSNLTKLWKLDSFMMESQRLSPPALISFNRIAKEPLTLSDGVHIPRGTHLAVAALPILMDPAVVPNPEDFDPMRAYRQRLEPGGGGRHQFTHTDKDHLQFGHGKYACPGRFFADNEIKIILSRLLLQYDFKFPEGKKRPVNFTLDENILPDMAAELMIRKRTDRKENDSVVF